MPSAALIVDDDGQYRDLMCRLLSHAGILVVPVVNGEDALRVLEHTPVDAIVTDLEMPRVNGRQLCAAIRQHSSLRTTPILLVSSASIEAAERLAIGADAFLKKPFDGQRFVDTFKAVLATGRSSGIKAPAARTLTDDH